MSDTQPNTDEAIRWLTWLRPGGPWTLTAIPAEGGPTTTQTFHDLGAARGWIDRYNGKQNVYFALNRLRSSVSKKAKKEEVEWLDFLHVDLDVKEGDLGDGLQQIDVRLAKFDPPPSAVIMSGGGKWAFWRLDEPLYVGGAANQIAEAEAYNWHLEIELGGDHCRNIDRICRLPGTVNLPDEKKRKRGRVATVATVDYTNDGAYPLGEFAQAAPDKRQTSPGASSTQRTDVQRLDDLDQLEKWGIRDPDRLRVLIAQGHDPDNFDGDRSKAVFDLCCNLLRRSVPTGLIVGIISDPAWPISAHVLDAGRRGVVPYAWRQVEQAQAMIDAEGEAFQTDKDGKPYANQHNIRLALTKLGATLKHDAFADRMLVEGVPDCGPYLDEPALNRLYLQIDELYRFRPPWEFFVKVVTDAARRAAFHPVRDYLDGLLWDGQPRLDGWLSRYGGAADTPYTRSVGTLMLIAAVRRVRHPGVKFDEMLILESKQGTNKSSALRILATRDDWFMDDLPLNGESKVLIERLAGRWIVEAAELKGMRKGEVEQLKGMLSKQSDTARLAYARLPVIVPRQCVIFGTTNSDRYLRDLTGNRRFWPVAVAGFDLDRLRLDVSQLWAEAVVREEAGDSIRLDPALWAEAEQEQDARKIEDPFASALATALGDQTGKISTGDVWALLNIPIAQRTQDQNERVGSAMRELGFERKRVRFGGPKPEWGYLRGTDEERLRPISLRFRSGVDAAGDPY